MENTIKDEYIDPRTADLDLIDREIANKNIFAVLTKVFIVIGGFNRKVPLGYDEATRIIEAFDGWDTHPLTKICHAYIKYITNNEDNHEVKLNCLRAFISHEDVKFLSENMKAGYYSKFFAAFYKTTGGTTKDFKSSREVLESMLTFPVKTEEDTKIQDDETVRFELEEVIKIIVLKDNSINAEDREVLNKQACLYALAAANGGHIYAQSYIAENFFAQNPNPPFFPEIIDRAERLRLSEHYYNLILEQGVPSIQYPLAHIDKEKGNLVRAEERLRKIIANHEKAAVALSDILKNSGRTEEAKEILIKKLDVHGDNSLARLALADLYDELGEYSQAYPLYYELTKDSKVDPKRTTFKVLEYQTGEGKPGVPIDDRTALGIILAIIKMETSNTITPTAEEKDFIKTVYNGLHGRAYVVDPQAGLRKLLPTEPIPGDIDPHLAVLNNILSKLPTAQNGRSPIVRSRIQSASGDLRRQERRRLAAQKNRFFILPQDPLQLAAAVDAESSTGTKISMRLTLEIAKLVENIPVLSLVWLAKAGEAGSVQSMGDAINLYFRGNADLQPDWVEALRLSRLALRDERQHGVPRTSNARTEITTIYKAIMAQEPGSKPRLWVKGRNGLLRPIENDTDKLEDAKVAPTDPVEAREFYLKIAESGSEVARGIVDAIDKEIQSNAVVDEVEASRIAEQQAEAIRIEVEAIEALLPPEPVIETEPIEVSEARKEPAVDSGFADNPLTRARRLAAEGQQVEASHAYTCALNEASLEIAERLAKIKEGMNNNLYDAFILYGQLSHALAENPADLPDDTGPRLSLLRERILEEAFIVVERPDDEGETYKQMVRAVESLEGDFKAQEEQELFMFEHTDLGWDNLLAYQGSSFDIDVEITQRLASRDRPSDLLAAFRMASDLLLDREKFPPQDSEASGPLPGDSPKHRELQKLWDCIASKLVSIGPHDEHEEYLIPGATDEDQPFRVNVNTVNAFEDLRKEARARTLEKPRPS